MTTLIAQAKDYANMTGSSVPVTDRVREYVNKELSYLYDLLVNSNEMYFLTTDSFSTVSGQVDYDLTDGKSVLTYAFYKGINLWRKYNDTYFAVELYDGNESWRAPTSVVELELHYIPELIPFKADGTEDGDAVSTKILTLPIGWEDYVAAGAARRLLAIEESDTSEMSRIQQEQLARMQALVKPRDKGGQKAIIIEGNKYRHWTDLYTDSNIKYFFAGEHLRIVSTNHQHAWY